MSEEQPEVKEEEQEESTTDNLFPEFVQEEEPGEDPKKEQPAPEGGGEPPEEPKPTAPEPQVEGAEYINLDELGNKKVKEIVNGKEVDVSLSELVGADQKIRAADQKFKEAAELRREAAEERAKLERERNQFSQYTQQPPVVDVPDNTVTQAESKRLAEMEQKFSKLWEQTAPLQIEANRKRMKDKFNDFDNVFPKMQEFVAKLPNTPESDKLINYFDKDPQGQELLYYKTKEMLASDNVSQPKTPESKEAPMERPNPPVVKVAPGTGKSSVSNDRSAELAAAEKRARKSNRDEDWAKILSLKGY